VISQAPSGGLGAFPEATAAGTKKIASLPWYSIVLWSTLPALLYFSTAGNFIKETGAGNDFTAYAKPSALARVEQIAVWMICVLLMIPLFHRIVRSILQYRLLLALMIFATASIAWSPDTIDSIRRVLLFILTITFGFYLSDKYHPEQQMKLILATGAGAALLSLVVVAALPAYGLERALGWRGIFGAHADLGMFLCFLFSPYPFLKTRSSFFSKVFFGFCVLLAVGEIFMSTSRGGWILAVSFIAYVVFFRFAMRVRSIDALFITGVAILVACALGFTLYMNYAKFTYFIGKDPSLTNRTLIWRAVMASIGQHPILGYGYGGFWNGLQGESANVISMVGISLGHAHNGLLNLSLQLGLIGVVIFLWTFVVAVRDAFRAIFFRRAYAGLWYSSILLLTLIGSIDESFLLNYNALTTILYVMTCVGLRRIASGNIDDLSRF
jgi:exopolysaccharide production protein ExoQ